MPASGMRIFSSSMGAGGQTNNDVWYHLLFLKRFRGFRRARYWMHSSLLQYPCSPHAVTTKKIAVATRSWNSEYSWSLKPLPLTLIVWIIITILGMAISLHRTYSTLPSYVARFATPITVHLLHLLLTRTNNTSPFNGTEPFLMVVQLASYWIEVWCCQIFNTLQCLLQLTTRRGWTGTSWCVVVWMLYSMHAHWPRSFDSLIALIPSLLWYHQGVWLRLLNHQASLECSVGLRLPTPYHVPKGWGVLRGQTLMPN